MQILNMKCCLCLQTTNSAFNIFEGLKEGSVILDIPCIIEKYIHFKPADGNPMLCDKCWNKIESFHIFCLQIEDAHKNNKEINRGDLCNDKIKIEIEKVTNENILLDNKETVCTDNVYAAQNLSVEILKAENSEIYNDVSLPKCIKTNYKREEKIPNNLTLDGPQKNKNLKIKLKKLNIGYSSDKNCNDIQSTDNFEMPLALSEEISTKNYEISTDIDPNKYSKLISKIKKNRKEFGKKVSSKIKKCNNEKKPHNNKTSNVIVLESNADDADEKIAKFMTLSCQLCSETLPTLAVLKSHYRVIHHQKGYATCCNKKFFKRYLLVDHIECHLNPAHFKCNLCDKTFSVADSLKKHMKDIHETDKEVCYCDQCPKKFIDKKNLARHKAYHLPIESWQFPCEECGKIFPHKFYLLSHKRFSHKSTSTKMCDICGKVVSTKHYQRHVQTHDSNFKAVKIQCHICNSFLRKKSIKVHLKNHEDANEVHICPTCGKKSPNRTALYKHMYESHRLKKTHHCTICNKSFKTKDLLLQHIPVHTGENNFKCIFCNRLFKFNSNLYEHKKKEHPIEFEKQRVSRRNKFLENQEVISENKLIF